MFKVGVYCDYSFVSGFFTDFKSAKKKGLEKLVDMIHDEYDNELGKLGNPTKYTQYKEDNDTFIAAYFKGQRLGYIMITPIQMDEWQ